MRAWLVDPLPNSLNKHGENGVADSKEKKKCYLGSVRVKLFYTLMFAYMYILHTILYIGDHLLYSHTLNEWFRGDIEKLDVSHC